MKKWLLLLLVCALLAGCGLSADPTTAPTEPETVPTEPPAPLELYVPASTLEQETLGTLLVYEPQWEEYSFLPLENGILLFVREEGQTHIYRLEGQTLRCAGELVLEAVTAPVAWTERTGGKGFACYDSENFCFRIYDRDLQEIRVVQLPTEHLQNALIRKDFSAIYYSTGTDLMVYDVAKSLSRPLRVGGESIKNPVRLEENETLLVYDDLMEERTDFCLMDVSNGQMVQNMQNTLIWRTTGAMYYELPGANHLRFAKFGQKKWELVLEETHRITDLQPETGKILTVEGSTLCIYSSESGKKLAAITLPETYEVVSAVFRPDGNVWITCEDQLLCWHTEMSAAEDNKVYTQKVK